MRAWIAAIAADVAAVHAGLQTVRGGWRAARCDARELIAHRRILVDTPAMTRNGMQVVLRTRLRLFGDTQTDILRSWLEMAPRTEAQAAIAAHFRSVAAAMGGWSVARAMERVLVRLTGMVGGAVSVAVIIQKILVTPAPLLLHTVLSSWALWGGTAFALLGTMVRWFVRWRLRAVFRRNPSAAPA
jgi:RNase P/RNase MRP subunit POP5